MTEPFARTTGEASMHPPLRNTHFFHPVLLIEYRLLSNEVTYKVPSPVMVKPEELGWVMTGA